MELFPHYCIDTNALIDLWRRRYARDVFPSLWKKIEGLISKGELFAPRQVLKELEERDDELAQWGRKHKQMFLDLDKEQGKIVAEILSRFEKLVDPNKTTEDADPFVIALAMSKGWTVITSETPADLTKNPRARPNIPDVCDFYKVKCIYHLLEFFREQKWEF